jgi:3-oxoacyl-[acyl-carrier protein] reductase
MQLLEGTTAFVTGAGAGIGASICQLFRQHGANLLLFERHGELARAVASEIDNTGANTIAFEGDVRDRNSIESALTKARERWGKVSILVNNAGVYPRQEFLTMQEHQWDEMQAINAKSMFHTCQAVLPEMIAAGSGKIVNISSVTFHLGMARLVHYVASKGAVIGLTRSLAREVGMYNVHVNAVTPGAILVEAEKAFVSDEQVKEWLGLQCLQRRILPIDVARVCLFLASRLSDGLTGQTINVDGGWVMY